MFKAFVLNESFWANIIGFLCELLTKLVLGQWSINRVFVALCSKNNKGDVNYK